jgi:hypothetical protein
MLRACRGQRLDRGSNIPDPFWRLPEACWRQAPADRPTFSAIVDQLKGSADLVFEGTDVGEYREYQQGLASERLEDQRPVELVGALYAILGWEEEESRSVVEA